MKKLTKKQLEGFERKLWAMRESCLAAFGNLHEQEIAVAIDNTWGVVFKEMQAARQVEAEKADNGLVCWEVFRAGRVIRRTPNQLITVYSSGNVYHQFRTESTSFGDDFAEAMGHFDRKESAA